MPRQTQPSTLVELLAERRGGHGGYVAVAGDGSTRRMSFAELFDASSRGAAAIAGARKAEHGASGGRAVITVADPLSFIVAFFSVMRAGYTPVPAPSGTAEHPAQLRRFSGIVRSAEPALIVTDALRVPEIAGVVDDSRLPVVAAETLTTPTGSFRPPRITSEDAAYLQYTSGSTSDPRPAKVLHRNALAELRLAAQVYDESASSVSVHWVPLYHGMGLVCSILRPLYSGYTSVSMDPVEFLRRPRSWLEQLSAWRASHTSSPTFGYSFTAAAKPDPSGLDLSSLRVARISSEMVPHQTLRDFADQLVDAGFAYSAFCPSYGLVEATLAVTSCMASAEPRLVTVSKAAFRAGVGSMSDANEDVLHLISSGPPLPETTVRILDRSSRPVSRLNEIGEVWISGPQVVPQPGDEIDGVEGRRTGDLGFLCGGELVPVGRNSERFKVRGVTFYSSEIETLIPTADPRFQTGRVAAFVAGEPGVREAGLVVIAEIGSDSPDSAEYLDDLRRSAVHAVSRSLGISVARVILVESDALPMTTSGKLRRDSCRTLHESGHFRDLTAPVESAHVESSGV